MVSLVHHAHHALHRGPSRQRAKSGTLKENPGKCLDMGSVRSPQGMVKVPGRHVRVDALVKEISAFFRRKRVLRHSKVLQGPSFYDSRHLEFSLRSGRQAHVATER